MKSLGYTLLLCLPLLFACQSKQNYQASPSLVTSNLYLDSQYHSDNPVNLETEHEIFRLSDDMLAMIDAKLMNNLTARQKAYVLLLHLFDEENISLSYDGNANVTASQAYHNKVANCMSLTIMAYAIASEAGMNVSFQNVDVPEYWVRNGQYNLLTGHVNLLVKESNEVIRRVVWGEKATQIDFDPFVSKKDFPSHVIQKHTLLAMFYNNKGAEELVNNNYPVAYQYLKKATQADSRFASAWGNLGILYKLSGHYDVAEEAYRHSISLKKNNLTSLGNLAVLLNKQERFSEAQPIEKHIHKLRIKNPYYHALLGDDALINKSYQEALKHYKKAIQLDDDQHEFYFGLAKAYYKQDRLKLAKRAMTKAVSLANVKDTQSQYIAKLNFLKYQETKQD